MSTTVEIDDVQSLVFSGHSRLPASLVIGLTVRDPVLARRALTDFATSTLAVGFGDKSRTHAAQFLLAACGISALGGSEPDLAGFSRQFRQGIVAPQRSRALGDAERSQPAGWGWSDAELHALLLIYATDDATAIGAADEIVVRLASGFSITLRFHLRLPADGREPFGFADGLSGTRVDVGDGRPGGPGMALLPPGEVILGYENAAGVTPPAPPLGENGTFVVLRQLDQNVQAFWDFWRGQGRDEQEAVWLASKALGRWPNGMPIDGTASMPEPAFDQAMALAPFQFNADPRGRKCPFGAHVRRANPRDGLGDDPAASLAVASHHRMVRRGRVYGPPSPPEWYPDTIRRATKGGADSMASAPRGLVFACLCADIARQFEFVQQTWLNNPKFLDLYDEVDPIAAGHGIPADSHRFSIPRPPLRRRLSGVTRWVQVRGGGYFLLPGKRALLRFLGSH
jgi:Dyp-type peroxidase family